MWSKSPQHYCKMYEKLPVSIKGQKKASDEAKAH